MYFSHKEKLLWYPAPFETYTAHSVTSTRLFTFSGNSILEDMCELADLAGLRPHTIARCVQVHGDRIGEINERTGREDTLTFPDTDALITSIPGVMLNVITADCLPVFFADSRNPLIALAHCGWRGTYKNLTSNVIERMHVLGSRRSETFIWFGPAICRDCYEVSSELVDKFVGKFGEVLREDETIKGRYLDLQKLNRRQAIKSGVPERHIALNPHCTSCRNDLFHSYRAEHGTNSRLISSILVPQT